MIKRRNYFIDKKFQTNFIFKFCLIVVAGSLLIGAILLALTAGTTTVAIENTKVSVKNTADFLWPIIIITLLLVTLFSGLAVGILSLLISHKISGPLYRIKEEVKKLRSGDLTANFHIRKGDQLQELANDLKEMSANLQDKLKQMKESSVKEEIAKIKELINYFKV